MTQEVVQTRRNSADDAVSELCTKLRKNPSEYGAVIFFASTDFDFEKVSELLHQKFPKAEVIGASSSGEISQEGFTNHTIVLNAISDPGSTFFKGILIDDVDEFPAIYSKKIERAASSIGVQLSSQSCSRNAFAISLICGLLTAEEGVLSLLYSIIKDPNFMVAGGSAGDDLKFKATYVSHNGVSSSHGAVILFVKTNRKFKIYKENIFQESGKSVVLTDVDAEKHLISSIDKKNPLKRYAEVLGISEKETNDALLDHPFGRVFGDEVFIASLVNFDSQGRLLMYARVLPNSSQKILEPMDAEAITEETCKKILQEIPRPSCIILFNCILRTVGFQKNGLQSSINGLWKKYLPVYSGFSTYGEQFGHINSNQTLVALVMGD